MNRRMLLLAVMPMISGCSFIEDPAKCALKAGRECVVVSDSGYVAVIGGDVNFTTIPPGIKVRVGRDWTERGDVDVIILEGEHAGHSGKIGRTNLKPS